MSLKKAIVFDYSHQKTRNSPLLQGSSLKTLLYTHFDRVLNTMPQCFQKETLPGIQGTSFQRGKAEEPIQKSCSKLETHFQQQG